MEGEEVCCRRRKGRRRGGREKKEEGRERWVGLEKKLGKKKMKWA